GADAAGPFEGSLSHSSERIELVDAKGKKVDSVKYRSRPPWPVAADGYSSSLERISPAGPSDAPENWAPSALPTDTRRPTRPPGRQNASYAPRLLPVVSDVTFTPAPPRPAPHTH